LAEDEVAEAPAHLRLHWRELCLDLVHVGAAHGELRFDLRVMGSEAELDAAGGPQPLDAGEELIDMRLAETVGMKPLQMDRRRRAAACQQSRNDLLFEHAAQLARHAGGEEE